MVVLFFVWERSMSDHKPTQKSNSDPIESAIIRTNQQTSALEKMLNSAWGKRGGTSVRVG